MIKIEFKKGKKIAIIVLFTARLDTTCCDDKDLRKSGEELIQSVVWFSVCTECAVPVKTELSAWGSRESW